MTDAIAGVLPVVHTPYTESGAIDLATMGKQIDYLFEVGADGFCLALVSDLFRLSEQERTALPAQLCSFAQQRGPVVINVAAESTQQAQLYARAAEDGGAAALMAIPPISRALGEEELRAYFASILNEVDIPVFVQDASSYVGNPMSIEFQASLFAEYGQRVLFKPEASPLGPCISALRTATQGQASIFEGSGGVLLVDSFRRGITGTIPGVELLDGTTALWNALKAGDEERAYQLYWPICALITLQLQGGLDGFIVSERYIMQRRGLFPNQVHRGPLSFSLDDTMRDEIDRLMGHLERALKG